jgi:hypothetical protein
MKTSYFLFGARITQIYCEEEFSVIMDMIKRVENPVDYSTTKHNPETDSPSDLLASAEGWGGFAEITEAEYNEIKAYEESLKTIKDA